MRYSIGDIVKAYELIVRGIEAKAVEDDDRAYGGIIRAGKGLLVENIAKRIVEIAWLQTGGKSDRLTLDKQSVRIPIDKSYLKKIPHREVVVYIRKHIRDYYYTLKTDVQVCIDRRFVMGIECKAYTENAMLKRILVDFTLLKQTYPDVKCVLFQLESQLTGDYCRPLKKVIYGSPSTHTLLSYFDVDLNIITLLEGERKVDQPIHKQKYYKALNARNLRVAVDNIRRLLLDYV